MDLVGQAGQEGVFEDGAFAVFQQDALVGDLLGQAAAKLGDGGRAVAVRDAGEDDVAVHVPFHEVTLVGLGERGLQGRERGGDLRCGGLQDALGGPAASGDGIEGVQEDGRGCGQGAAGGMFRG